MASDFHNTIPVQPNNGMGTAALVLGIVALVLSVIPILGLLSWVLAPLAIIFGIIGVNRDGAQKGGAIAGIITGVIAFLICIAWAVAFGAALNADKSRVSTYAATGSASSAPPLAVSAKDLFRAYQNNEARAQADYGDRPLLVSGTVSGVNLNFMNDPVVLLQTDNEFMSAQAELAEADQPRAKSLSKGQTVSLLCQEVTEVIGTPMLKDCQIR